MTKDKVKTLLNKFPEVTWDRYSKSKYWYSFFGWIDRKDKYKDYVELTIWLKDFEVEVSTSSAKYSAEFCKRLNLVHRKCYRVESFFKSGVKSIKLKVNQ